MFLVPTVFVIGAGAGTDIDMPVGGELSKIIAEKLDIRFEAGDLESGDQTIVQVLRRVAKARGANPNEWFGAGRTVASGIEYTGSIDAYINAHKDNEKVRQCAKLAIVQSILEKEQSSAIFVGPDGKWQDPDKAHASLLRLLMQLLQEGIVVSENLDKLFQNVTVINFNYDRCIEHFLFHAVQHLYQKDEVTAARIVSGLRIFHPYGSVGFLPWWGGQGRKVGFGVADYGDIIGLSEEIFTFNEQMSSENGIRAFRKK